MRIFVAEDEPDLNALIVQKLTKEGYAVDTCFDGVEAWDYLSTGEYDVAVLDIMMPRCDGITLVKRLRKENNRVPILFLTAKDTVDDKVEGLDSGGNDYLTKPFSFKEMLARIRVLTRKGTSNSNAVMYQIADLTLDIASHCVFRNKEEITLSTKEFAILECLMRNTGAVLSREMITQSAWNFDYEGDSNMVDVYISYLRKKIDGNQELKLIHTIRGVGYVIKEEEK